MFGLFKKSKKQITPLQLLDLEQNILNEGDIVESLRYDLGEAKIIKNEENNWVYESLETGTQVSWLRMIDAITKLQKVRKIS